MCAKICIRMLEEEKQSLLCMFVILRKKMKETGTLIDKPKREKPKTMRTPADIAVVAESVCEALSPSIHRRSQKFKISETSLRRILHKDLGMMPYKVQLVQQLKPIAIDLQKMKILANKNHLFR